MGCEDECWIPAPVFAGGQALRGETGGRDGSPPPVFTGAGSRREDNGGERDGRFANKPLPDGCQTGGRDGSPPPVFTGAGSRREDNGEGGVRVGGWG